MQTISMDTQVGERPYQEDRMVVNYNSARTLLAVIDGHGGSETAEYVHEHLPELFRTYNDLSRVFAHLATETALNEDGAAVSVVVYDKDFSLAQVAILGDSLVVIRDAAGLLNVSPEHNVRSNPAEADAACARGGIISGGYLFSGFSGQGLQMSRALGDASLSSVLNREPEIYSVALGPNSFILLGTDGVFDPGHEGLDLKPIIEMIDNGANAYGIVSRAINLPTHDNATAILVRA